MKKQFVIIGIIILLISIGLSGCSSNEEVPWEINLYTAAFFPTDSGSPDLKGCIMVRFAPKNTDGNMVLKEVNYIIYGNGHYVGGAKITEHSGNTYSHLLRVYSFDYTTRSYKLTLQIDQELKNALENKLPVEWSVSGDYTQDNDGQLVRKTFSGLTQYQTVYED